MFNLLRMDLYRARKSKSVYVCLSLLLTATVLLLGMLWMMAAPQGQEIALRIGLLSKEELGEFSKMLNGMDSLSLFREMGLGGGGYNLLFGIWVMLFVCMDFQSGFIKNVMALYQNRWNYVGSKILTAGIVNICYLVALLIVTLLMNRLFGNLVPYAKAGDVIFYLSWAWLLTTAFAVLVIMICIMTRSVAAGSVMVVLLSSGIIVTMLYSILSTFHIGDWLEYTIYMTLSMGPIRYSAFSDLYVYVVGVGFLLFYTVIAGFVLRKQDI